MQIGLAAMPATAQKQAHAGCTYQHGGNNYYLDNTLAINFGDWDFAALYLLFY